MLFKVLYGPRVYAGPFEEYNVEEGEQVELTCTANGNPPPLQYEWFHVTTGMQFALLYFICLFGAEDKSLIAQNTKNKDAKT